MRNAVRAFEQNLPSARLVHYPTFISRAGVERVADGHPGSLIQGHILMNVVHLKG